MSGEQQDIDLRIRATNQSKGTLAEVTKSVADLTRTVAQQTEAANKAGVSLDELKGTTKALGVAQDQLRAQRDLVKQFQDLAGKTDDLNKKNQTASEKYDALNAKVSAAGVLTEKDDAALKKSAASRDRANKNLQTNVTKLGELTAALGAAGIATNTLDGLSDKLAGDIADVSLAIQQSKNNTELLTAATQAQAAADKKAATESALVEAGLKRSAEAARARAAEHEAFAQKRADRSAEFAANQRQFEQDRREAAQQRELLALKQQMIGRAREEAAATRQQTTASNQLAAADKARHAAAEKALAGIGAGERTSLGLLQRIRGEVLALTASYVGLQAGIGLAKGAVDAGSSREGVKNQLGLSVGNDKALIDAEYEYVRKQADRIGLEFDGTVKGFAKFSAAASQAGKSRQEIRYIFEAFSEVGKVANLTTDDMNGVFKALEQITSKGKIQAEELRGQLGERLFGAFEIAAKSLKDTFPDLEKAMKGGLVTSDQLIKIAELYRKIVAEQLPAAMEGIQSQQNRWANTLADLKKDIFDAGFGEAYLEFIKMLNEEFSGEQGKAFAKTVSDVFTAILKLVTFLIQNRETVSAIVALWFGGKVLSSVEDIAKALPLLMGRIAAIGTVSAAASPWVLGLTAALNGLMLVGALFAGFKFGTYLYEQVAFVRKWGLAVMGTIDALRVGVIAGFSILWNVVKGASKEAFVFIMNGLLMVFTVPLKKLRDIAQALGKTEFAGTLTQIIDKLTFKTDAWADATYNVGEAIGKAKKELEGIGLVVYDGMSAMDLKDGPASSGSPTETTKSPGAPKAKTAAADAEAAAKKLSIAEQIDNQLKGIEAQSNRRNKDSLEERVAQFKLSYSEIAKLIAQFEGEAGGKFTDRLNAVFAKLEEQEREKFAKEIEERNSALETRVEGSEAKAGKKESLQERLDAVALAYKDLYDDIADARDEAFFEGGDTTLFDDLQKRQEAAEQTIKGQVTQAFYLEELAEKEKLVTAAVEERASKLEILQTREQSGDISHSEYLNEQRGLLEDTQGRIEHLTAAAREYAEANREAFDPEVVEAFNAKMEKVDASAKGLDEKQKELLQKQKEIAGAGAKATGVLITGLVKATDGTGDLGDAFDAAGKSFAQFAADFMMRIAEMIIQEQILAMIKGLFAGFAGPGAAPGGVGGSGAAANAGVGFIAHTGGVVGSIPTSRGVNPGWFDNAPRYHSGGVVGLQPDEYPTILQKHEEVLSRTDPRNILNGGRGGAGQAQSAPTPQSIRIINTIDSGSMVQEGLSTPQGEKAFFNMVQSNRKRLKQVLA